MPWVMDPFGGSRRRGHSWHISIAGGSPCGWRHSEALNFGDVSGCGALVNSVHLGACGPGGGGERFACRSQANSLLVAQVADISRRADPRTWTNNLFILPRPRDGRPRRGCGRRKERYRGRRSHGWVIQVASS